MYYRPILMAFFALKKTTKKHPFWIRSSGLMVLLFRGVLKLENKMAVILQLLKEGLLLELALKSRVNLVVSYSLGTKQKR